MPNVGLLRAVLAEIEADPAAWDQRSWARRTQCGTTYCFAGHAVRLGMPDAEMVWSMDWDAPDGFEVAMRVLLADGSKQNISAAAAQLLGVQGKQLYALFYGEEADTLAGLRLVVEEICAGAVVS